MTATTTTTEKHALDRNFFLAGRAHFTVEPPKGWVKEWDAKWDREHYTYNVKLSRDGKRYFVGLMTGSDNSSEYDYLGMLLPETGEVVLTRASLFPENAECVKVLRRTLKAVWEGRRRQVEDAGWGLHHEGRCCRCGRRLTVPASVETGVGPECESFVALGLKDLSEVPSRKHPFIAHLQYHYWMTGDRLLLDFGFVDACQEYAGMEREEADHLAKVTRATMRKFKKGAGLRADWVDFAKSARN